MAEYLSRRKQIAFSYAEQGAEPRAMNFGLIPSDGGLVAKIAEMPRTAIFSNYQFKCMPNGRAGLPRPARGRE